MLDVIFWIVVSLVAVGLPAVGLAVLVCDDMAFSSSRRLEARRSRSIDRAAELYPDPDRDGRDEYEPGRRLELIDPADGGGEELAA